MPQPLPFWPKVDGKPVGICGSPKKLNRGICKHPAGFRTQHLGDGPCILHGGCFPNVVKRYAHVRLMRQLVAGGYWSQKDMDLATSVFDRPSRSNSTVAKIERVGTRISYMDALDALMSDTMKRVTSFKEAVDQIPLDEDMIRAHRATYARFDTERHLAAKIAKDAIAADIDRRRLLLDEAKADELIAALARAAATAELDPEVEERFRQALAIELKQLPAGK